MRIHRNGCKLKLIVFVFIYLLYLISTRLDSTPSEEYAVATGVVRADTSFVYSPKVFAINYTTDRVYSAHVNEGGYFTLDSIPSGTYTFYAQAFYFGNDTISNVALESADGINLVFNMSCINGTVPYPYTYKDTVLTTYMDINGCNESETESINFSQYGSVLLEASSTYSNSGAVDYCEYGVFTSNAFRFSRYPLEANMSWFVYTTSSYQEASNSNELVQCRVRSVGDDGQTGPWSEPFTSPMNIEPFLDGDSERFQYEMVLRTDNLLISPIVDSRRIHYSYNTTIRLVDGEPEGPPRF